jgi:hypothetical protein
MAPQCLGFVFLVLILVVCKIQGDNTGGNIFAARVEVSVISLSFNSILILMYMKLFILKMWPS